MSTYLAGQKCGPGVLGALVLDVKTILFSLVVAELTASAVLCFLFFFWKHRDRAGHLSFGLWSIAFLLGAIGTLLISFRGVLPDDLTIIAANFLILFATGLRRSGVAAFFHQPLRLWIAAGLAGVWLLLCSVPDFATTLSSRVAYVQPVMILYIAWSAIICLRWNTENLVTPKVYAFSAALETSAHFSLLTALGFGAENGLFEAISGHVILIALLLILVAMVLSMFTALAMPIERSLLQFKSAAYRDCLTGLPNRRAVFERAATFTSVSGANNCLTVIRFDIDEFKRVNDKHGHATGDLVLQVFGRVCEETTPADTVAGRLGGDEFVILSTRMEPNQARILAERIRAHFAAACSEETEGAVQVGLSAGVSSVPLDLGLDEALEIADRAMYEAKACGRGKTVVGSAEKARVFSGTEDAQFAFYAPHPA